MKLNENLVMSQQDIDSLNALPDNLPASKLTKKQIEVVSNMYRKYCA